MGFKDFLWQWIGDLVVHCVCTEMEIGMVTLWSVWIEGEGEGVE